MSRMYMVNLSEQEIEAIFQAMRRAGDLGQFTADNLAKAHVKLLKAYDRRKK